MILRWSWSMIREGASELEIDKINETFEETGIEMHLDLDRTHIDIFPVAEFSVHGLIRPLRG